MGQVSELKNQIYDDLQAEKENIDNLYDESGRIQRDVQKFEDKSANSKGQVSELKKIVSEKNQEIGDYIDQRDADIDDYAKQLRTLLKQRKEMKFRIEEAKGTIAGMQMEKEKYQFERIKFEMDSESDSQEGSKEQIMTQLEHRLREANDSYR